MFCQKCGNEILDGAEFCPKCGARREEAAQANQSEKGEFIAFVENHVRQTTKFQSTKELLNGKAPMRFAKISFGIPALLGIMLCIFGQGNIFEKFFVSIFLVLLFGYAAAFISCTVVSMRHAAQFTEKHDGEIDMEDLLQFLNTHLDYLYPYFHKWDYLRQKALSIRGAAEMKISDMAVKAVKEVNICATFGEKEWRVAVIWVRPDMTAPDSGRMQYGFSAMNRVEGASFLSHDMGFAKYKCLFKIAPILQAAMKYYLEKYGKE